MERLLLLHPEDDVSAAAALNFQMVVDLARAPVSTYEGWSRIVRCPVYSIFDLNEGSDDLHCTRELLECGMGFVVDRFGIDWWDLLAQSVVPQLQQLILVRRLTQKLGRGTEIYVTRPHFLATALAQAAGGNLHVLRRGNRLVDVARRYSAAMGHLDWKQFAQVLQDKFDSEHTIRRRFAHRHADGHSLVVLLPSAYVNVSRTAVAYAEMLPEANFLLMLARRSAAIKSLPPNVRARSLDAYFSQEADLESSHLQRQWKKLTNHLRSVAEEFAISGEMLDGMALRIGQWLRVRDAWNTVFQREEIAACLCADDSNPYSRLPLLLAKQRGIPAVACHHGALDSRMGIKRNHADHYLAKSKMERDYLTHVCECAKENILVGAPASTERTPSRAASSVQRNWLVFFSEPFSVAGWRAEQVYQELLPNLSSLAQQCHLELVFKLHPFESVRGHRRLLQRCGFGSNARILSGAMPAEIWAHTRLAVVVQSTVALDCAERGIPVFLCGWLADQVSGYAEQFARFGVGKILHHPDELQHIPTLLASEANQSIAYRIWQPIEQRTLCTLLNRVSVPRVAVPA